MEYNPQKIEKKWQKIWEKTGIFRAKDKSKKPKFYCLDMFPYPSAEGLHVGHPRGYVASDIISHYFRRKDFNVLHPMGWDAFGLPAENYAIRTGIHPAISTRKNIKNIKRQIKSIGLSYDWSKEIDTTKPEYYKLTQWIFLKLFEKGLAYEAILPINWCPSCKTGLANEEVVEGKCERCGNEVGKKDLRQWVLRITAYAERLLEDLKEIDWPEKIIEMQRNWIGKSEGWEIKFKIKNEKLKMKNEIPVFTTRTDTLFGCTYLVLAPEHSLIEELKSEITNYKFVKEYIERSKKKTERERISEIKEKTGIEIKGIKAINPANGREIPIWVADYVLIHYGTGAIMAVPCHDQRDFDFARRYNLPMVEVIKPYQERKELSKEVSLIVSDGRFERAYEGQGYLINSGRFDGLDSEKAKERIGQWLAKKGLAKKAVHYKLRDWIFSRQRYWGEPIPLVFCQSCKKQVENSKSKIQNPKLKVKFNQGELLNPGWIALSEKDLPLKLPKVKKYQPTGTGESPLAAIENWVRTKCPKCGAPAKRETNTMPQWAGSCWYYIGYTIKDNKKFIWNKKRINYWLPVDLYIGGAEHAVLHLLYARFWHKFLSDLGLVSTKEPFLKLRNQGLILAPDGQKMSKSRGNVISPDSIVREYGADTLRLYEMFIGPFDQEVSWSLQGIKGCWRFLQRVWRLKRKIGVSNNKENESLKRLLHRTIKKVTEDIESFKFNTAISSLMVLVNKMEREKEISLMSYKLLIKLLAPFAPHLSEEIWQEIKENPPSLKEFKIRDSIHQQSWPRYDRKLAVEEKITLIVQVNSRVRDKIEVKADISEEEAKKLTLEREKVKKWIEGKEIKKIIFVPGKLINIVI